MPEPASVPDQLTVKVAVGLVVISAAGRAATLLTGAVTSRVLSQVGVLMAAFESKTTLAVFVICVPVDWPDFGITLNSTLACPSTPSTSGGRKPTVGSVGGRPVEGSIEVNVHLSKPVD